MNMTKIFAEARIVRGRISHMRTCANVHRRDRYQRSRGRGHL